MLKWLINKYWNWRYPEWTRGQVEELFKRFNGDIFAFHEYLKDNGFKWGSDGLNISRYTDTFARPEQVLARKFGNCGDYMRLYEEFIKFSGCAKKYVQYEMTKDNSFDYHYVMLITLNNDDKILQSNLSLLSEIAFEILSQDYDNVKIIDKWEREALKC